MRVLHVYILYFKVCCVFVCWEFWGHDVDFTRAFILVLVMCLSFTINIYLWFALHEDVAVCVTQQTDQILNFFHWIICNSCGFAFSVIDDFYYLLALPVIRFVIV